ncbi:MAG: S24/S26 family peptidase [Clostridia bacterium]|nr:S24/S26 family peptidase [Clostridia bacterium]
MTRFEDLLQKDGRLVYKTKGTSMEPMLRQNRDLVIIEVPSSRLQRYDVALYRRDDKYVLHRVIGVEDGFYRIRGDNTYAVEQVSFDAVIGVLKSFNRKGKLHSVTDRSYRFYARFWNAIYPLRAAWRRVRQLLIKIARKLGILPLLKKLLRRK